MPLGSAFSMGNSAAAVLLQISAGKRVDSHKVLVKFNVSYPYPTAKFMRILGIVFFTIQLTTTLFASPVLVLEEGFKSHPLGRKMEILEDKTGQWSIEDVTSAEFSQRFFTSQIEIPNFGITSSVYWVRFQLRNPTAEFKFPLLEMAFARMEQIELFFSTNQGGWESKKSGMLLPFRERDVAHHNYVFQLKIPPQETLNVYLRFESIRAMQLPLILWESKAFFEKLNLEFWEIGSFFGIMIVMAVYNLFIFFSVRDRGYLYYVFYIVVFTLLMMSFTGISVQYLWPNSPWWASQSIFVFAPLVFFGALLFVQYFLQTQKYTPVLHQMLSFLKWTSLLVIGLGFFRIQLIIFLNAFFAIISIVTGALASYLCWARGYRPARFLILAWTALLVGAIVFIFQRLGYLPVTYFTEHSLQIGALLEVVLLSLSLADRISVLRQEKEEAQAEALKLQRRNTQFLEEQVADRTHELTTSNRRLKQEIIERQQIEASLRLAQEEAESANKAKTQFLANMSHEIRTPLNAIIGFTQILSKEVIQLPVPEKYKKYLQNIWISGQNLLNIINNILDLTKIESDKMELLVEPVSIQELVQDVSNVMKVQATQKQQNFTSNLLPGPPLVIATDRMKLNQILTNLLSNAIKFTPTGKNIQLATTQTEGQVIFQVIDQGIGIPKDKQQMIFDPFEQVDNSITRDYGGTGLGLAISKRMVELLEGSIELSDNLEGGSTFTVKIPISGITVSKPIRSQEKPQIPLFDEEKMILLVEDNLMNQVMTTALFESIGLRVQIANHGKEGVAKTLALKPDLVLMDIHMPIMDGLEAIRQIRSHPEFSELPIVILSADAFTKQQMDILAQGVQDYLTKPIEMDKLLLVLQKYL